MTFRHSVNVPMLPATSTGRPWYPKFPVMPGVNWYDHVLLVVPGVSTVANTYVNAAPHVVPFQYRLLALFRMLTRTVPTATSSSVVPVMSTVPGDDALLAGAVTSAVGAVVSGVPGGMIVKFRNVVSAPVLPAASSARAWSPKVPVMPGLNVYDHVLLVEFGVSMLANT